MLKFWGLILGSIITLAAIFIPASLFTGSGGSEFIHEYSSETKTVYSDDFHVNGERYTLEVERKQNDLLEYKSDYKIQIFADGTYNTTPYDFTGEEISITKGNYNSFLEDFNLPSTGYDNTHGKTFFKITSPFISITPNHWETSDWTIDRTVEGISSVPGNGSWIIENSVVGDDVVSTPGYFTTAEYGRFRIRFEDQVATTAKVFDFDTEGHLFAPTYKYNLVGPNGRERRQHGYPISSGKHSLVIDLREPTVHKRNDRKSIDNPLQDIEETFNVNNWKHTQDGTVRWVYNTFVKIEYFNNSSFRSNDLIEGSVSTGYTDIRIEVDWEEGFGFHHMDLAIRHGGEYGDDQWRSYDENDGIISVGITDEGTMYLLIENIINVREDQRVGTKYEEPLNSYFVVTDTYNGTPTTDTYFVNEGSAVSSVSWGDKRYEKPWPMFIVNKPYNQGKWYRYYPYMPPVHIVGAAVGAVSFLFITYMTLFYINNKEVFKDDWFKIKRKKIKI